MENLKQAKDVRDLLEILPESEKLSSAAVVGVDEIKNDIARLDTKISTTSVGKRGGGGTTKILNAGSEVGSNITEINFVNADSVVQTAGANGNRVSVTLPSGDNEYHYNMRALADLFQTGPCNMLIVGDSTSSIERVNAVHYGIKKEWDLPLGWKGIFHGVFTSASGPLTTWATSGQGSEAACWPIVGSDVAAISGVTKSNYGAPGSFGTNVNSTDFTSEILTGVTSPIPNFCTKFNFTGPVGSYQTLYRWYMGHMGAGQIGPAWATGDWITGKSTIQMKIITLAHAAQQDNGLTFDIMRGYQNPLSSTVTVENLVALTQPATPAVTLYTLNIPAAQLVAPFGAGANEPGANQNSLILQYEGVGTTFSYGTFGGYQDPMNQANFGTNPSTQIGGAGAANFSGALRVDMSIKTGNGQNGESLIVYGSTLEDSANPNGTFMDFVARSGATTTYHLTAYTTQQLANKYVYRGSDTTNATNFIFYMFGQNNTSTEYTAGQAVVASEIYANHRAVIQKFFDAAVLAGIPAPKILIVSPPQSVGEANNKSTSTYHQTVAEQHRIIAEEFVALGYDVAHSNIYAEYRDRFTTDQRYSASRTNPNGNLLVDGVHDSVIGCRMRARIIWDHIKSGFEE